MKVTIRKLLQNAIIAILITTVLSDYRVGVGISDVTGPIVQVNFLGYADILQKGSGIHLRQFARAFIIEENLQRIVFVSVDVSMIGYGLRKQVLIDLKNTYGTMYNEQNFILSATHTHSAPGGFTMEFLYDISTYGYVPQTFQALRTGIVKAVKYAHQSVQDARIFINTGILLNASINRSPLSYLLNPKTERDEYSYNVDKEIVQLKFIAKATNSLLGVLNWFPVHPTSMNKTNTLVSSDNVGYASILFEQHINKNQTIGKGPFVAAFASSNLGDVSPNIKGPRCINTGCMCDDVTSSCNGKSQNCIASGPGKDIFESTKIIATRLFEKGLELLNDNNSVEVHGSLKYGHQYVDMPNEYVERNLTNGTVVKLHGCSPAMGYSFAAGTTDGPGGFDFTQGTTSDNPVWNLARNLIAKPTQEDIACHYPKPIFLATGRISKPYEWQPKIVSIQIAIVGNIIIAAVPGEFTTMAGRRLKKAIQESYIKHGGTHGSKVIIAGLSNTYSSYVVTPEEYDLQRYEAASTIYGPNTLDIYLKLFSGLIKYSMKKENFDHGVPPPDLSENQLSLTLPVLYDLPMLGTSFGDCLKQPPSEVEKGTTITVTFVAANPRNNLMLEKTFLTVERLEDKAWTIVATDANWETKLTWTATLFITGNSYVDIEWYINPDTPSGIYRIRHFGYYKPFFSNVNSYQGLTKTFRVV